MSFEENCYQGMTGIANPGIGANTYQRRLTESSERQTALLERRGDELRQTNNTLAREAERSRQLSIALHEDLVEHTDQITRSVESLQGSLCGYLGDLVWLAEQQKETLDGILDALLHHRRTEAQELVEQALRLMANGEYGLADERLSKALEFDPTDYQVLRNLGVVKLEQKDLDAALEFFQLALARPGQNRLDRNAKSGTLLGIAHVQRQKGDFTAAYRTAVKALQLEEPRVPRSLLTCGGHAALAGMRDEALANVEAAIKADPSMFGVALVEPDLGGIRASVDQLLTELVKSAATDAQALRNEVVGMLNRCKKAPDASDYSDILAQFDLVVRAVTKDVMEKASYSQFVTIAAAMQKLLGPLKKLHSMVAPQANRQALESGVGRSTEPPAMTEEQIIDAKTKIESANWSGASYASAGLSLVVFGMAPFFIGASDEGASGWLFLGPWGFGIAAMFALHRLGMRIEQRVETKKAELAPFENRLHQKAARKVALAATLKAAVEEIRQDFDKA